MKKTIDGKAILYAGGAFNTPDGGRLPPQGADVVEEALTAGLNVDNGLHDFLYKNPRFTEITETNHCRIRDIRRNPDRDELHFFSGKIEHAVHNDHT